MKRLSYEDLESLLAAEYNDFMRHDRGTPKEALAHVGEVLHDAWANEAIEAPQYERAQKEFGL